MLHNPYKIVKMFEEEVAHYAGAPYAVAVDSCSNALFLCCLFENVKEGPAVGIPRKTYLSVPQSVIHAGGRVRLMDKKWQGIYQLLPYPIFDAAKRLTSGMYLKGTHMCLSFHIKKHLKIGKGGMILTDNPRAVKFFKRKRYEGRNEVPYKDDNILEDGYNMYMSPENAARGLMLMQNYPQHAPDLLEEYRDLREFDLFKNNRKVL